METLPGFFGLSSSIPTLDTLPPSPVLPAEITVSANETGMPVSGSIMARTRENLQRFFGLPSVPTLETSFPHIPESITSAIESSLMPINGTGRESAINFLVAKRIALGVGIGGGIVLGGIVWGLVAGAWELFVRTPFNIIKESGGMVRQMAV